MACIITRIRTINRLNTCSVKIPVSNSHRNCLHIVNVTLISPNQKYYVSKQLHLRFKIVKSLITMDWQQISFGKQVHTSMSHCQLNNISEIQAYLVPYNRRIVRKPCVLSFGLAVSKTWIYKQSIPVWSREVFNNIQHAIPESCNEEIVKCINQPNNLLKISLHFYWMIFLITHITLQKLDLWSTTFSMV